VNLKKQIDLVFEFVMDSAQNNVRLVPIRSMQTVVICLVIN